MKLEQFLYVRIAGIFCLILTQPAFAEKNQSDTGISINTKDTFAPVETRLKKIKNQLEEAEKSISNIPQLSEIQLPKTSVKDLLAQEKTTPAIIQINAVRLQKIASGLEVVLETSNGELSQPATEVDGKTLVANIQKAVLALPEGNEFQAKNPADGIASVTIAQLNDNTVQVRVIGVEDVPIAQITNSDRGLTLSLDSPTQADIELTITAQKRPEDAQDVPLSVTPTANRRRSNRFFY